MRTRQQMKLHRSLAPRSKPLRELPGAIERVKLILVPRDVQDSENFVTPIWLFRKTGKSGSSV